MWASTKVWESNKIRFLTESATKSKFRLHGSNWMLNMANDELKLVVRGKLFDNKDWKVVSAASFQAWPLENHHNVGVDMKVRLPKFGDVKGFVQVSTLQPCHFLDSCARRKEGSRRDLSSRRCKL